MSEERAALIRRYWDAYRALAATYLRQHGDVYRCPIHRPLSWHIPSDEECLQLQPIECLEFRREHGWVEGERASRIVCDGIVVEMA